MRLRVLLIVVWLGLLGARAQMVDSLFTSLSPDKLTLLVYYDPDCTECRQELFALRHASIVESKISEGLLQILAIYQGDDAALWQEHRQSLPATWQVVMRPTLSLHPLGISLLDADQKVMLSNANIQQITKILSDLWE